MEVRFLLLGLGAKDAWGVASGVTKADATAFAAGVAMAFATTA